MSHQEEDLAARVRAARNARKWSQKELADRAGVSERWVSGYEARETKNPHKDKLRNVLTALDLDPDGTDVAAATRATWPQDVQAFLDAIGAWLVYAIPERRRSDVMHDVMRQIFQANNG